MRHSASQRVLTTDSCVIRQPYVGKVHILPYGEFRTELCCVTGGKRDDELTVLS